ncbi:hypothetical protein [Streptomyces chattanoogensis]|uniref:Uncharacterized protein n=1 Tax=Streptomyces chattanoogensis TaxID=66876 RepID=A0A0N0Y0E4_9ACTN|nr:hypothetical protein [Streptomyces chattanoogensis]KPC67095.1 hypothetical protein ADL29_02745 [Streptomyces chattanoogensis]
MGTTTGTTTTDKRADDETAPEADAAQETAATGTSTEPEDGGPAEGSGDLQDTTDDTQDDTEDSPETARPTGVAAGAGAVVAAGLGLASVTGTWLGTLMSERQKLVGQIGLQSGKVTDPIAAAYGTPWHTTALVNGVFALLAMIVAGVALTQARTTWVRAVAWGGLVLGVLGLFIAAGMYLDLFASMPAIPKGAAPGA